MAHPLEGVLVPSLLPEAAHSATVEVDDSGVEMLNALHDEEWPAEPQRWAAKRMREFRAGRHAARRMLTDLGLPGATVARDASGVPLFPREVAASITHTGGRTTFAAAAGVRGASGLGLDAEQARSLDLAIVQRVLGARERQALLAVGPLEQWGLLAFSAKEAFYKCVFPKTRAFLEFHQAEFWLTASAAEQDTTSGAFTIVSDTCRQQGGPASLAGRFVWTPERVITAVVWE